MQQACNGFAPLQHKSVALDLHQHPATHQRVFFLALPYIIIF
jgi:hypothetical protein